MRRALAGSFAALARCDRRPSRWACSHARRHQRACGTDQHAGRRKRRRRRFFPLDGHLPFLPSHPPHQALHQGPASLTHSLFTSPPPPTPSVDDCQPRPRRPLPPRSHAYTHLPPRRTTRSRHACHQLPPGPRVSASSRGSCSPTRNFRSVLSSLRRGRTSRMWDGVFHRAMLPLFGRAERQRARTRLGSERVISGGKEPAGAAGHLSTCESKSLRVSPLLCHPPFPSSARLLSFDRARWTISSRRVSDVPAFLGPLRLC